jgi:hypothetical protein
MVRMVRERASPRGRRATWQVSLWARLHDGGLAHAALRHTLSQFFSSALLGLHPKLSGAASAARVSKCTLCVGRVGGAGEGIFQMDANGGVAGGVAEMLLQSHGASCAVHLLPALPPVWTDGAASGLRARGALRVDLVWAAGRLSSVSISRVQPSAPTAARDLPQMPLSVCCPARVCGADRAALAAATRSAVHELSGVRGGGEHGRDSSVGERERAADEDVAPKTVWAWQVADVPWSMELGA